MNLIFLLATVTVAIAVKRLPKCGIANDAALQYQSLDLAYKEDDREFKILGGSEPDHHMFPFMASLFIRNVTICTATIIGERYILTAEHCLNMEDKEYLLQHLVVQFGALNRFKGHFVKMEDIYFTNLKNADFAIIKLKQKIKFDENAQPICLTANPKLELVKEMLVAGFGYTPVGNGTVQPSDVYKIVTVPIRANGYCKHKRNTDFCAGASNAGTMAGDSGGPAIMLKAKRFYQIGLTAGGRYSYHIAPDGTNTTIDHGTYVRVSAYCDFIADVTQKEVTCGQ
uniref:Peptidase S1 domain-containing protein n=1 Tax=Panagrellus redivivus TaxID=6233 RepID=A0A7E4VEP0_PANRE